MIDRFVYTAMTGAKYASSQLATTTHNLANVNTPGFREMLSAFRTAPVTGAAADSRAFVVDSTTGFNTTPGALQQTGNPMDIALVQDGFFAFQVDGNAEAYSRQGRMRVNSDGYLVNSKGQRALSTDNTPIQVGSDNHAVYFQADGSVWAKSADGQSHEIAKLKVVNPAPESVSRRPDGLFDSPAAAQLDHVQGLKLSVGAFETSNVNVAQSMVEMIKQNRMFDLNMRMVQTADQNARSAQSLLSLSRN